MNRPAYAVTKIRSITIAIISCWLMIAATATHAEPSDSFDSYTQAGRSVVVTSQGGQKIRVTPYGDGIVRVQLAAPGQAFLKDSHYEMVENHKWPGAITVVDRNNYLRLMLSNKSAEPNLVVDLEKSSLRLAFGTADGFFLTEKKSTTWLGSSITQEFIYDPSEHFTALGHDYFGRVDSLDLRGQELERNYQRDHEAQAPLIVPFYISSKGYGVFLNSSFRNKFRFGVNNMYSFSLDMGNYAKDGQMDYFVLAGPAIKDVLRRYVTLTGHPRLPPKAMFGLGLSDKGDPKTSDAQWWQNKVRLHRDAGFPLDHLVNDNRWRAAGGERCKSAFAWDPERYPNPTKFSQWATMEHLVLTLDFNRCIAPLSEGYDKTAYNIPNSEGIDFADAAPDLTNAAVRKWWWNTLYRRGIKALENPPAVGLWIDEFDQMGPAPDNQLLNNGRSFAEMRNYWFMLVNKALVEEGWDKNIGEQKRPFVWVRGNTAGGQRYSTLWSGDIQPTYEEMKSQIRGMQAAGLSGFPYWGHDAGGFDSSKVADFDTLYRQWSLAMGSFSPFWKPHGIGPSRWPLDRSMAAQADFLRYSYLRYQLMPYTYTYAHRAATTGEPIARAMLFNYPERAEAWQKDLQFLWGDHLLIAPNTNAPTATGNAVPVWLPPGGWYDFWNDKKYAGNQELQHQVNIGELPLFVAEGTILPMTPPSLSIADARKDILEVHVYTGSDGKFTLYEDDGVSEKYQRGIYATQEFIYQEKQRSLHISPVQGDYKGMPLEREYHVIFHGLTNICIAINNADAKPATIMSASSPIWSDGRTLVTFTIAKQKRSLPVTLKINNECSKP